MYLSTSPTCESRLPLGVDFPRLRGAKSCTFVHPAPSLATISKEERPTAAVLRRSGNMERASSDSSIESSTGRDYENSTVIALSVLCAVLGAVLILSIFWTCVRRAAEQHIPLKDDCDGPWTPIDEEAPQGEHYRLKQSLKPTSPAQYSTEQGERQNHWRNNWNGAELYHKSLKKLSRTAGLHRDGDDAREDKPRLRLLYIPEDEEGKPDVPHKSWRRSQNNSRLQPISESSPLSLSSGEHQTTYSPPKPRESKSVHFAKNQEIIPAYRNMDGYFESLSSTAEDSDHQPEHFEYEDSEYLDTRTWSTEGTRG